LINIKPVNINLLGFRVFPPFLIVLV